MFRFVYPIRKIKTGSIQRNYRKQLNHREELKKFMDDDTMAGIILYPAFYALITATFIVGISSYCGAVYIKRRYHEKKYTEFIDENPTDLTEED